MTTTEQAKVRTAERTVSPVSIPVTPSSETALSQCLPTGRFVFIDALRGVAALLVVLNHLVPWQTDGAAGGPIGYLTRMVSPLAEYGNQGVTIFFVISGFVIAHSVRGYRVTPGFLANFALRRSIRLDPPYWASIIVALAFGGCAQLLPQSAWCVKKAFLPSWGNLASHLTYTQFIFHHRSIQDVYWTLTLEVQFYLIFVVLLGIGQKLFARRTTPTEAVRAAAWVIFLPLGLACLATSIERLNPATPVVSSVGAWFFVHFHFFLLGAFAAWSASSPNCRHLFWIFAACFGIKMLCGGFEPSLYVGTATAVTIYLLATRPHLGNRLKLGKLADVGLMSYSLYLIHYPVGAAVRALIRRVDSSSAIIQDISVFAAIAGSIFAAMLLYRGIEAKTIELARRLKRPGAERISSAHAPYIVIEAIQRAES